MVVGVVVSKTHFEAARLQQQDTMLGQPETEGTLGTSSAKRAAEDWEKTMCYIFNL